MKHHKPFERKFNDLYAGVFYACVDKKNRLFIPSILEKTIVYRNQRSNIEDLETVVISPGKNGISCYDALYYYANKENINHEKIYVSKLDFQRRLQVPKEVNSLYPLSSKVSISASKKGDYFIIKNQETKK